MGGAPEELRTVPCGFIAGDPGALETFARLHRNSNGDRNFSAQSVVRTALCASIFAAGPRGFMSTRSHALALLLSCGLAATSTLAAPAMLYAQAPANTTQRGTGEGRRRFRHHHHHGQQCGTDGYSRGRCEDPAACAGVYGPEGCPDDRSVWNYSRGSGAGYRSSGGRAVQHRGGTDHP